MAAKGHYHGLGGFNVQFGEILPGVIRWNIPHTFINLGHQVNHKVTILKLSFNLSVNNQANICFFKISCFLLPECFGSVKSCSWRFRFTKRINVTNSKALQEKCVWSVFCWNKPHACQLWFLHQDWGMPTFMFHRSCKYFLWF